MNVVSRIYKFIPEDLMLELNKICRDVLIPDNNTKVDKMVESLNKYNVDFQELGPGTNRFAVLIDGYVFKIAMDKAGVRDNWAEFSLTQELQPFVTKVYECNGLLNVSEYVTVISKEEFQSSKEEVRQILSHLAQGYLLGDVGSVNKNFMNWGYRPDGSLVILDFAYIYRVIGDEMICGGVNHDNSICREFIEYDINFHNLICPRCRKSYTFHDIRRKINKDYEDKELNVVKQIAIKVDKEITDVNNTKQSTPQFNNIKEGDDNMGKHKKQYVEYDEETAEQLYLETLNSLMGINDDEDSCEEDNHTLNDDDDKNEGLDIDDIVNEIVEGVVGELTSQLSTDVDDNDPTEDIEYDDDLFDDDDNRIAVMSPNDSVITYEESVEDKPSVNEEINNEISVNICGVVENISEAVEDDETASDDDINEDILDDVDVEEYEETIIDVDNDVEDIIKEEEIDNTDILETDATLENIAGIKIIGPDTDVVQYRGTQQPQVNDNISNDIIRISNNSIDEMRNELLQDLDVEDGEYNEYEEYEDLYDDNIRQNQNLRQAKRQKRNR